MRYSRLRRRKTKQRYAAFILTALLLFVVIYVISAGTLGKFVSNLISPILIGTGDKDETNNLPGEDPLLTVPEDDPTENSTADTVKITAPLKANALSMYAIQMGAFTDGANAETFAQELRSRGGAGFILNDGFHRVLAIGFQSEEDAKKVRDELKVDGIESHVYKIASAGVNMNITATEANVNAIRSAYLLWENTFATLENLIIDLDSGTIGPKEAYDKIKNIHSSMEEKHLELQELNANQTNNVILSGLVDLFRRGIQSFNGILSQNSSDKVAISSKIKYTNIDMLIQYKDYMEQITK